MNLQQTSLNNDLASAHEWLIGQIRVCNLKLASRLSSSLIGRKIQSLIIGCLVLFATAISFSNPSYAYMKGSGLEYSPCFSCGTPIGASPPPGLYGNFRDVYVNNFGTGSNGKKTTATTQVQLNLFSFTWVPGWKILGGEYRAAVGSLGPAYITPTISGVTNRQFSLVDPLISPIVLSWSLGHHFYVSQGLNIYLPLGQYDPNAAVNTGLHKWTFEPIGAISYLTSKWDLTAKYTVDVGMTNNDILLNKEKVSYTSGSIAFLDLTAARNFGNWSLGAIGQAYDQITNDNGPKALNGGWASAASAGVLAGYNFGRVSVTVTALHGIYARNASYEETRIFGNLGWKFF